MRKVADRINPSGASMQTWHIGNIDEIAPQEVHATTHKFNSGGYEEIVDPLRAKVRKDQETGIAYALLSEPGDSLETAVAHINPFACPLNDNMLVRAEFCRQAFRAMGITDPAGRHLPVLTMASPSWQSGLKLNRVQKQKTAEGYLVNASTEYLKVIRNRGVGQVAVLGASYGAAVALPAAHYAQYMGMDGLRAGVADPPTVVDRGLIKLFKDNNEELKELEFYYKDAGLGASVEAHDQESAINIQTGVVRRAKTNIAISKGLSRNSIGRELWANAMNQIPTTVGYGSRSRLCPKDEVETAIEHAQESVYGGRQMLHGVKVEDAGHLWDNNLPLLATFYGYALSRSVTIEPVA